MMSIALVIAIWCSLCAVNCDPVLMLSKPLSPAVPAKELLARHLKANIAGESFNTPGNTSLLSMWEEFIVTHGVTYDDYLEYSERFEIFASNVKRILEHNVLYMQGKSTFAMGINRFMDKTEEEWSNMHKLTFPEEMLKSGSKYIPISAPPPAAIDWREKGAVTPVKDQGQCGSCWAFSTTGSIEGQHFRAHGRLASVSEQQLVDCSSSFGNNACDGGLMVNAFKYLMHSHGIESEESYPYISGRTGRPHQTCLFNIRKAVAKVTGFVTIPPGQEEALQQAVGLYGPVSVAVDASSYSFMSYKSGVYQDNICSSTKLNHAVLAVGYGIEQGIPYWLIKNSWGTGWGERGYMKLRRNAPNMCGVASMASYPLM